MKRTLHLVAALLLAGLQSLNAFSAINAAGATNANAMGPDAARHLLSRTGFGVTAAELDRFSTLSQNEAVDRILASPVKVAATPPPAWVDEAPVDPAQLRSMSKDERDAQRRRYAEQASQLREWWFSEMLSTTSPLTEKMTLFWHNHFATSVQKVRFPPLMYRQNALLRSEALGNFATLLHAVARDPAMLVYLDGANSRKEKPNENFAREVMELFTLGEGHYSEQDIKEAARAFTGWSVDRRTGKFVFRRALHDAGIKTIFGHRGRFNGDDVIDLLLARPETAEFITTKLWREFVSPDPDAQEVKRLAALFRKNGYDISALMRALLNSDAFFAAGNCGALVKSPVEFVLGTLRTLQMPTNNVRAFSLASALLGQNLFTPPNVKGWPGGDAWINSATLLGRKQFVARITGNDDGFETAGPTMKESNAAPEQTGREARSARVMDRQLERLRPAINRHLRVWASRFDDQGSGAAAQRMARLLLPLEPQVPLDQQGNPVEWLHQLLADPAFQLK